MTTDEQRRLDQAPDTGQDLIARVRPAPISREHFVAVTGWFGVSYHLPTSARGVAIAEETWTEVKRHVNAPWGGPITLRNVSTFVSFALVELIAGLDAAGIPPRYDDQPSTTDGRRIRSVHPRRRVLLPDTLWTQAESIVASGYADTVDQLLNEAIGHLVTTMQQATEQYLARVQRWVAERAPTP